MQVGFLREMRIQSRASDAFSVMDGNEQWILQPCAEGADFLGVAESNEMASRWRDAVRMHFLEALEHEVADDNNTLQELWVELPEGEGGDGGDQYLLLDKFAGLLLFVDELAAAQIPRSQPKRSVAWR